MKLKELQMRIVDADDHNTVLEEIRITAEEMRQKYELASKEIERLLALRREDIRLRWR